ncbi:thiamine-phosphate kinase, partial [Streptosporangium saharense]|uniref:thiamine-phosphate kinase n=1 Tax=Streptosporangium saharense TaxID=1706840 RepID=UPI00336034BA
VAVAGRLGHAAAGLALLGAGETGPAELLDAHRRPIPPYACGPRAAALGATSMLDVSDGLLQDLGHVAKASGVGIVLLPEAFVIPAPMRKAAQRLGADPLEWILSGGEDHALAATFPQGVQLPPEWAAVGHVEAGEGVQVRGRSVTYGGWDHFRE